MKCLKWDKDVAVCVKPVGVSSEDEPGGMPELIRQTLGGEVYPIHRLDLNVGGVMVYARNKAAAGALSRAVSENRVVKEYLAILEGEPQQEEGILEDLLWKDSRKNKVFAVKRERKGVKKAKLAFKTLEKGERTLVWVRLYTGRSHQIRVQFSSRGCPLVGDHKYGSRAKELSPGLWSARITFPHPKTGEMMTFTCLPENGPWEDFASSLEELKNREKSTQAPAV